MKSPRHVEQTLFFRTHPEKIVLPAASTTTETHLDPVRIFLGSEDGQYRAERVFIYSIDRVRSPNRRYEIYIMKNLTGFDRGTWRTGFTLYRYAIPTLAGGKGKAIYNDVDQIYLSDPAELFDLDMNSHGYMSVSNTDTSVMLIDCERMKPVWNMHNAQTQSKKELNITAAETPGLWASINPHWNARDMEYERDKTKLLHYTLLHWQPWQPTPDSYSYHAHPLGYLWFELERAAIQNHYHVFSAEHPSEAFTRLAEQYGERSATKAAETESQNQPNTLYVHFGPSEQADQTNHQTIDLSHQYDEPWLDFYAENIIAVDLFERLPQEDIPWVMEKLFQCAERRIEIHIASEKTREHSEQSDSQIRTVQAAEWWHHQLAEIAYDFPAITWRINLHHAQGMGNATAYTSFESQNPNEPKTVWLLMTNRHGDNAQVQSLAQALPWHIEKKNLKFKTVNAIPNHILGSSLHGLGKNTQCVESPPWPDYVISSGRRAAPVAKWIKKASSGKTRLIHIGRPWCDPVDFDLVITTPQYRLPLRDSMLHNALPLNRIEDALLATETEKRKNQTGNLSGPFLTVVIGGPSRPYVVNKKVLGRMAEAVNRLAQSAGYSVLVCTSPRTPKAALSWLTSHLTCPYLAREWSSTAEENPYPGMAGLADAIVITGDSASMVAELCKLGKPIYVQRLPRRPDVRIWMVKTIEKLLHAGQQRSSYRDTPKQQSHLARFYDELVVKGWITSIRDLDALFEHLTAARKIQYLHDQRDFFEFNLSTEDNDPLPTTADYILRYLTHTRSERC